MIRIEYIAKCKHKKRSVCRHGVTAETERTEYTNEHDVKGCQESRPTITCAIICQGVLAYTRFLSEIQRIAFSHI